MARTVAYNLLKLADRLFAYEPRAAIYDYYERALYNHILGQQDPKTSMVCYFTPLQTGAYRLYSTRDSSFWCCVGSGFESHAKYQSSIYFRGERQEVRGERIVYVNLFIPSELNADGMMVRQETNFPYANTATITASGVSTLKVRYPAWATYMKVNGKKVKAGKDGYVNISLTSHHSPLTTKVEFGMSLHEEATTDDPSCVALLYGPIVLAGELDKVEHPFSDPKKYNDYYTFNYGKHDDIRYRSLKDFRIVSPLHYVGPDGISVKPFYDLHHHRYVVYWKQTAD